jgi:hypothetical protein
MDKNNNIYLIFIKMIFVITLYVHFLNKKEFEIILRLIFVEI